MKKNIQSICASGCLLLALLLGHTGCSSEQDSPLQQEIVLTTPVVKLADIQATASRGETVTPIAGMTLQVELLKKDGNSYKSYDSPRNATYSYDGTSSKWSSTSPLVVTAGEGKYYARALASNVNVSDGTNNICGAFYSFSGTIAVQSSGTFSIGNDDNDTTNDMQPLTAAIKVVLKDANGDEISADLDNYEVSIYDVNEVTDIEWTTNGDVYLTANSCQDDIKSAIYGYYQPTTVAASSSLLTITHEDNLVTPTKTTTWKVYNGSSELQIEAGKLYTFTITLGGQSSLNISSFGSGSGNGNENGIYGFDEGTSGGSGNNINIGR